MELRQQLSAPQAEVATAVCLLAKDERLLAKPRSPNRLGISMRCCRYGGRARKAGPERDMEFLVASSCAEQSMIRAALSWSDIHAVRPDWVQSAEKPTE
jgi:hypothetical protein